MLYNLNRPVNAAPRVTSHIRSSSLSLLQLIGFFTIQWICGVNDRKLKSNSGQLMTIRRMRRIFPKLSLIRRMVTGLKLMLPFYNWGNAKYSVQVLSIFYPPEMTQSQITVRKRKKLISISFIT